MLQPEEALSYLPGRLCPLSVDSANLVSFSDFCESVKFVQSIDLCVKVIQFTFDHIKNITYEIEGSIRDHSEAINELLHNIALFAKAIKSIVLR